MRESNLYKKFISSCHFFSSFDYLIGLDLSGLFDLRLN